MVVKCAVESILWLLAPHRTTYFMEPNVSCSSCGVKFYRSGKLLEKADRHFCSQKCSSASQQRRQACICLTCSKEFIGKIIEKRKFCSLSCSAKYNNTHKQYGIRRSKLEQWVEQFIRIEYPEINLVCNGKSVIGSELDFYFPDLMFAIELNGIVHYEPIYGEDKFQRIQDNDRQKGIRCYEQGIELATIDVSACGRLTQTNKTKYYNIIKDLLDRVIEKRGSRSCT